MKCYLRLDDNGGKHKPFVGVADLQPVTQENASQFLIHEIESSKDISIIRLMWNNMIKLIVKCKITERKEFGGLR